MRLGDELRNPWGILVGGIVGGLGWAVGIPVAAATGIGAAVWAVRGLTGAASSRGGADAPAGAALDPAGVRDSLKKLRSRVKGKVPDDIYGKVDGIADTIEAILPRSMSLGPGSDRLFVLTRTATDYLPTAIEAYLNLPREYAEAHQVTDGKTAHQLLVAQLDLLQTQMDQIAVAVNKNDTDKLIAHGRFLEERFGQQDLTIDQDPPATE